MEKIIQSESVFNDESPFHTYDVENMFHLKPDELSFLKNGFVMTTIRQEA